MQQYTKAIITAVATLVATITVITRQDPAEGIQEQISYLDAALTAGFGAATTILVYLLPNKSPTPPS